MDADSTTDLSKIMELLQQISNDRKETNDVLYGNPRLKNKGLVDLTKELSEKITALQNQLDGLAKRMDIEAVQKKAIEDNQAKMWSSVKSWGGLATAIMGIGQIINIIINLKP